MSANPPTPSKFNRIVETSFDLEDIQQEINRQSSARPEMGFEYVAPHTPMQKKLAAIWADVLGLESVGLQDDLFALGGHSISATQILSRARETFQVEISLDVLFDETFTVAKLAREVAQCQIMRASPEALADKLRELASLSDEDVRALLTRDELR
jgi:syringomycin synthetase protein SyrE